MKAKELKKLVRIDNPYNTGGIQFRNAFKLQIGIANILNQKETIDELPTKNIYKFELTCLN